MAKNKRNKSKGRTKSSSAAAAEGNEDDAAAAATERRQRPAEADGTNAAAAEEDRDRPSNGGADDSPSSSSDDDDDDDGDDDLILEGVMRRVPGVPSSSEDEDDEEQLSSEEEDEGPAAKRRRMKGPPPLPEEYAEKKERKQQAKKNKAAEKKSSKGGKGRAAAAAKNTNKSKSKNGNKKKGPGGNSNNSGEEEGEIETINVDFTFCDMNEKFFHGIKTLLTANPIYVSQSSALSDLMIENVSVGTVISTEGCATGEDNVFGFASVLNVTTNGSAPCVQHLKKLCLDACPAQHRSELETVLSGRTRRPAGFLIHGRMVNTPLEITDVLHQQLVLDMDWAVKNAEGGEEERKSLDFGAFVVMAPCTRSSSSPSSPSSIIYKNFDDEIFASNAEFVYTFDAPRGSVAGEDDDGEAKQLCSVIVMTKTGHREAMKDLAKLIRGGS